MKEKRYHYYNDAGQSIIDVCLIDDGINVARGVAVRSKEDVDDVNNTLAYCRALRAIKKRKLTNNKFKDWRAIKTLIRHSAPFIVHSELNPPLSFFERKLLFGKKLFEYEERAKRRFIDSPQWVGPF